jgi:DNA polymerase-3 subunit delta'
MKFSEIQSSTNIKNKLIQTVLDQRVSHAQLFFGPENSNKLALAIAYAQFINCTNKQIFTGEWPSDQLKADSCGTCPSCVKYQKLAHPDLHFIYPVATTKKVTKKPQSKYFIDDWRKFLISSHYQADLQDWYEAIGMENKQGIINADDCNEIITTLSYKSYESDYKVMIIWMVEKLFYAAAPKILKILEEPPEKTLFILISDDPDQIIKTIVSRTLLVKIPGTEFTYDGSNEEDETHFVTFRDWMRLCFAPKIYDLIGFTAELSRTGREKQKSFLIYALKTMRFCAAVNNQLPLPSSMGPDESKFIIGISPFITNDNIVKFNTLINDAIYHVERNAYPSILFLDLSLKFVRLFKPNSLPL